MTSFENFDQEKAKNLGKKGHKVLMLE